jgi:hypothetical protein
MLHKAKEKTHTPNEQKNHSAQKDLLDEDGSGKVELENVKYKFQVESQEILEKYRKTLKELEGYKWALRFFFTLLLGGSIFGFLKYQEYLDTRIAERMQKLESFSYALVLINNGENRSALGELDDLYSALKLPEFKATEKFKIYYYYNVLRALNPLFDMDGDGSYVGKFEWDRLNNDDDFKRSFKTDNRYYYNDFVQNTFAICTLKYTSSPDVIKKARGYFERAQQEAITNESKAVNTYDLAMLDLIENNEPSAIENFKKAEGLYPKGYSVDNLVLDDEALSGGEFQMYVKAAERIGNHNFQEQYKTLVNKLVKQNLAKKLLKQK